jgi:hypothetical protein
LRIFTSQTFTSERVDNHQIIGISWLSPIRDTGPGEDDDFLNVLEKAATVKKRPRREFLKAVENRP